MVSEMYVFYSYVLVNSFLNGSRDLEKCINGIMENMMMYCFALLSWHGELFM